MQHEHSVCIHKPHLLCSPRYGAAVLSSPRYGAAVLSSNSPFILGLAFCSHCGKLTCLHHAMAWLFCLHHAMARLFCLHHAMARLFCLHHAMARLFCLHHAMARLFCLNQTSGNEDGQLLWRSGWTSVVKTVVVKMGSKAAME